MLATLAAAIALACGPREADETEQADDRQAVPIQGFSLKLPRWALRNANVHAGRSTDSDIVTHLTRGVRIEVSGAANGWVEVFRDGQRIGYIAESMLRSAPLRDREFQMRDVSFRVSDRGDESWAYSWELDLENTGLEPYPSLEAILKFVDGRRRLIAADTALGLSLSPGERRTFSGTLMVLLPVGSTITNVGVEIREPGD